MALTQTDLDALDSAIASGELKVQLEGRSVEYRSIDQLLKARQHVAALVASGVTAPRRRTYYFNFATSRGD